MSDGRAIPLRFGSTNEVPDAALSASPTPTLTTPLSWLKDERRARSVHWTGVQRDVVISGTFAVEKVAQYVALPNATLIGLDSIRLDLFTDTGMNTLAYSTGFAQLAAPLEIGVWIAGIDPYGSIADEDKAEVFVAWLPQPIVCRAFRLTIRPYEYDETKAFALRSLMIGQMLQMSENFVYGGVIKLMTEPNLVRLSSGGYYPTRRQKRSRRLQLPFDVLPEADRAALGRMEKRLAGDPFVVSAHAGRSGFMKTDYAFVARFASALQYQHRFEGLHATDLELVEV